MCFRFRETGQVSPLDASKKWPLNISGQFYCSIIEKRPDPMLAVSVGSEFSRALQNGLEASC